MNAFEVGCYMCGHCGEVHRALREAERCCLCRVCDVPRVGNNGHIRGMCDHCREAKDASWIRNVPESLYEHDERAAYEDSESLCDGYGCDERECEEDCDGAHGAVGVKWGTLHIDAYDLLERYDRLAEDDEAVIELQQALDGWLEGRDRYWRVDDRTRVYPDDACRGPVDAIEAFARWLS